MNNTAMLKTNPVFPTNIITRLSLVDRIKLLFVKKRKLWYDNGEYAGTKEYKYYKGGIVIISHRTFKSTLPEDRKIQTIYFADNFLALELLLADMKAPFAYNQNN